LVGKNKASRDLTEWNKKEKRKGVLGGGKGLMDLGQENEVEKREGMRLNYYYL